MDVLMDIEFKSARLCPGLQTSEIQTPLPDPTILPHTLVMKEKKDMEDSVYLVRKRNQWNF